MSVVGWRDQGQIKVRLYSASGGPVTGEITVASGAVSSVSVGMDGRGNFVVAWTRETIAEQYVQAAQFSFRGTRIGSNFRVGRTSTSTDGFEEFAPHVAVMNHADSTLNGSFVIGYTRNDSNLRRSAVLDRYSRTGKLVQETLVAQPALNYQTTYNTLGSVGYAPNGEFAVAFEHFENGDHDVLVNRYDADGKLKFTSPTAVTTGYEGLPSLAINNQGVFVVYEVRPHAGSAETDLAGRWVYGATLFSSIFAIATSARSESHATVAVDPLKSKVVVAYQETTFPPGDPPVFQVHVVELDVSTSTAKKSIYNMGVKTSRPSISMDGKGYYFVTYDREDVPGDNRLGVFARAGRITV